LEASEGDKAPTVGSAQHINLVATVQSGNDWSVWSSAHIPKAIAGFQNHSATATFTFVAGNACSNKRHHHSARNCNFFISVSNYRFDHKFAAQTITVLNL
jgi:hypothetical protein